MIIYKSYHHGNTKKVAEAMAGVLDAKLAAPGEVNVKSLDEYDIIGFGSGIYYARFHKEMLELIEKLPSMNKKAFLFYTCGSDQGERYVQDVKKTLSKKGFSVVGRFSCPGWDTIFPLALVGGIKKGRPNVEDLKKAAEFAKGIIH
jgi:flavodoxin